MEDHVVFDQSGVTLVDRLFQNEATLSQEMVIQLNVWIDAHASAPYEELILSGQGKTVIETNLYVFHEDPLARRG